MLPLWTTTTLLSAFVLCALAMQIRSQFWTLLALAMWFGVAIWLNFPAYAVATSAWLLVWLRRRDERRYGWR
jgi:hypothetical protein